jgi:type II secretory ATPase GspE/PulE/Tfp pilus assembly ATPase PilB-like protein
MRTKEITGIVLKQAIQAMLTEAIEIRASDLRLDKKPDPDAWASHRIDGVVHQTHLIPEKTMAAIYTRLKNECGMDASDSRRDQDGRISITYKGRQIDFRVNTMPVEGGESMSLRVLDPDSVPGLETLFPNQPDMTEMFRKISRVKGKQGGIILFSGPTGSGKTTSLYSLTQRFPRDQMNIMTVEDPIEYRLLFTRQVQRNRGLDQKMTDVERAMLRQDPDVLVLGEIRDSDSMKAALHFAESGHLVLATIHSNSAEETLGRVLSFIEGEGKNDALYMLANTLRLIVNQRLAPRLCSCAVSLTGRDLLDVRETARSAGIPVSGTTVIRAAKGCPKCRNTGYYNRVAAHETLIIPTDHLLRVKFAKMLFASMANFSQIRELDGIIYKSRPQTFEKLIEGGVVDVKTATDTLSQEYT